MFGRPCHATQMLLNQAALPINKAPLWTPASLSTPSPPCKTFLASSAPGSAKPCGRRWLRWIGRTASMVKGQPPQRGHFSCQRLAFGWRGQPRRDPWARMRCCAERASFSTASGVNSSRPHATALAPALVCRTRMRSLRHSAAARRRVPAADSRGRHARRKHCRPETPLS